MKRDMITFLSLGLITFSCNSNYFDKTKIWDFGGFTLVAPKQWNLKEVNDHRILEKDSIVIHIDTISVINPPLFPNQEEYIKYYYNVYMPPCLFCDVNSSSDSIPLGKYLNESRLVHCELIGDSLKEMYPNEDYLCTFEFDGMRKSTPIVIPQYLKNTEFTYYTSGKTSVKLFVNPDSIRGRVGGVYTDTVTNSTIAVFTDKFYPEHKEEIIKILKSISFK